MVKTLQTGSVGSKKGEQLFIDVTNEDDPKGVDESGWNKRTAASFEASFCLLSVSAVEAEGIASSSC